MPTRTELLNEAEWRRCRGSSPTDWEACRHFLENHCKIRHPERGRIPFELRDAQIETLEMWLTQRYSIVLKARQIGYSTLAACMSLWLILFWSDKYVIMLSRTEREAQKLFAKAIYSFKYLDEWMLQRSPGIVQRTLLKLSFNNDSSIECLPSTQDPARGESAYMVIVDEWAFLEDPEEAWSSIEPVADVGGRVIGLSTANGSGTFFETFWVDAVEGKRKWAYKFFPWSANSDRDQTWYEDKADDLRMTPWILHQEYPRNPEEAFIKSGRNVFDPDQLDQQELLEPKVGDLWARTEASRYAEFQLHPHGQLRLYEVPTPGSVYVIGADVAEGLEHGDYSSAHVLEVGTGSVVAHWHGHIDPDLFGNVLYRLGYWYNTALLGVESNNHGLTTLTGLQRLRYPRIYKQRQLDTRGNAKSTRLGWHTNVGSKGYVIDGLVQALRPQRALNEEGKLVYVGGMGVRDQPTIRELKTYVREPDGKKMHGSPHDDRVMSLAIAQEMTRFAHSPQYKAGEENGWGTLKWWEEQIDSRNQVKSSWVIGANSERGQFGALK